METVARPVRSHLLARLRSTRMGGDHLAPDDLTGVSHDLDLTASDVFGVASFYPELGVGGAAAWRGDPSFAAALPTEPGVPARGVTRGGFLGLGAALDLPPADVLEALRAVGVTRRMGGEELLAPTLARLAATAGGSGCVVCDAAEHDAAAAGVTWLVGAAPEVMLAGLAIAAHAAGATRAVVFVAGGSAMAAERLSAVVDELDAWRAARSSPAADGEGGRPVLHVDLVEGLPALVMSEETALLAALEGRRPMPGPERRPSRDLELWGAPCTVVDAEVLARLPGLFAPEAATGAPSGGTAAASAREVRLFTVSGCVARAGVLELAADATLAEMVAAAGGLPAATAVGAVQVGGPTGVWLPESLLGLAVDDPVVRGAGSRLFSGGVVVADASECAVALARRSLAVLELESCGRCVVCREGLMQMTEVVTDILAGRGRADDIDLLRRLAQTLATTGPCDWGRAAANPVLSTLRHFGADYEAHLKGAVCRTCAAGSESGV